MGVPFSFLLSRFLSVFSSMAVYCSICVVQATALIGVFHNERCIDASLSPLHQAAASFYYMCCCADTWKAWRWDIHFDSVLLGFWLVFSRLYICRVR